MRRLAVCLALIPGAALAHASERMVILTLPTGWYMIGAGIAVALTAGAGLMAGRLPRFGARLLFERRVVLSRTAASWIAALAFWALIATGIWGTRDPLTNLLPLTVWTVLWVGLTLACVLFGNLWRDIEPWSGPVRTLRRMIGRTGGIGLTRLGHWPAVIGYLGFAWFEIVSLAPADPYVLARAAAGYYLLILALAVLEGEGWLEQGEFLTVYFAIIGRIAPFWAEHEGARLKVMAGLPGVQVLRLAPLSPSTIAFVTLVLASVSFDGLSETFRWLALLGINPLEFPGRSAVWGINSVALIGFWGVSIALILGAIRAGLPKGAFSQATGPVMLSFLPIAAGYHVAHYLIALLTNGQYAIAALNDPFGRNWQLLGLPDHWVSFGFLATHSGVLTIWTAQFSTILGAHLLAVMLNLKLTDRIPGASGFRAHLPMTLLMVGYTVFGLWLLSAPTAG
ncbi:hypothetical protein OEZ71_07730 [Defluviimonas sp. WL0050]|uniref:Fenitrothion hydrolase n=1 Tax=Albidovulum litorale TaxID=2984134 RepID=A0ABT2ZMC5_9RHOB|nr:hypothetical protein [Defluviimonas sp. WL0050]MCV2872185.1 hypothetical protein [Defluviimonas sp. WL0050]